MEKSAIFTKILNYIKFSSIIFYARICRYSRCTSYLHTIQTIYYLTDRATSIINTGEQDSLKEMKYIFISYLYYILYKYVYNIYNIYIYIIYITHIHVYIYILYIYIYICMYIHIYIYSRDS